MRAIHDDDCAIHTGSPICDCGSFLKCSRLGTVPGLDRHRAALKASIERANQDFANDIPNIQRGIHELQNQLRDKTGRVESIINDDSEAH